MLDQNNTCITSSIRQWPQTRHSLSGPRARPLWGPCFLRCVSFSAPGSGQLPLISSRSRRGVMGVMVKTDFKKARIHHAKAKIFTIIFWSPWLCFKHISRDLASLLKQLSYIKYWFFFSLSASIPKVCTHNHLILWGKGSVHFFSFI